MIFIKTMYTFCIFLEILITCYIITSWLFKKTKLNQKLKSILVPLLSPVSFMLDHSAISTTMIDFSPIVVLIVLAYFERLLGSLM